MTIGETTAIIVSICSLLITTVLTVVQLINSNRNNRRNLQANLIKDMYEDLLVIKIPKGREYIHFDGNKITGVDNLIDAISSIRRSSLFFKKVDKKYYEGIREACQSLEEFLNDSTKGYRSSEFNEFMNRIDRDIDNIYSLISDKYSGR